jgi:hypothetical protein
MHSLPLVLRVTGLQAGGALRAKFGRCMEYDQPGQPAFDVCGGEQVTVGKEFRRDLVGDMFPGESGQVFVAEAPGLERRLMRRQSAQGFQPCSFEFHALSRPGALRLGSGGRFQEGLKSRRPFGGMSFGRLARLRQPGKEGQKENELVHVANRKLRLMGRKLFVPDKESQKCIFYVRKDAAQSLFN